MSIINENNIKLLVVVQAAQCMGYDWALAEITRGKKISHWICMVWYIFTMLRRLGHTRHSHYYCNAGRKETEDYLTHPILDSLLKEIADAILK